MAFGLGRLGALGRQKKAGGGGPVTPNVLTASKGAFSVTGQPAGLVYGRLPLAANVGTFAETGQAAGLLTSRVLTSDVVAFILTGQAANLVKATPGSYTLTATQGTFVLTGDAMNPVTDRKLPSDLGTFALTGQAANLVSSARVMTASQGTFTLTGQAANLVKSSSTTTWDPTNKGTGQTLSGSNLISTGDGNSVARSVAGHSSGKYYYEVTVTNGDGIIGCCGASVNLNTYLSNDVNGMGALYNGAIIGGGTVVVGTDFQTGTNIVGVAVDVDNRKFWFRVNNGTWDNTTDNPATNTGGVTFPSGMSTGTIYAAVSAGSASCTANFGGSAYLNAAPSGFGNW